jgi:hypothetical protein
LRECRLTSFDHTAGRQVHGIEQTEQGALRVGAGDDGFCRDFFAAC